MYAEEAVRLASLLVEAEIGLVYGGGGTGLMGEIARAVKNYGGHVTGVIPQALLNAENILISSELDALHVTNSYHERKMLMYHLSDGFIALPGGPGTLEELIEHLTWMHRGRSYKPVYIVNQSGYWDPLLTMFDAMQNSGFISFDLNSTYSVCESSQAAIYDFIQGDRSNSSAKKSHYLPFDRSVNDQHSAH